MEWISVKDRLPEYGQVVYIYNPYDGVVPDVKFVGSSDDERWISQYMRWRGFVTHWILLEPPKEEN